MFGAVAVLFLIALFFGVYIFIAYVLWRVGRKCGIGSYIGYLVPFYNILLLCDCAKLSRWFSIGVIAPGLVAFLMHAAFILPTSAVQPAASAIALAATMYIWGNIARRLGKNPWLWGILTPILFGIPIFVMAFDNSSAQY